VKGVKRSWRKSWVGAGVEFYFCGVLYNLVFAAACLY
jgi:hypothetical protein